MLKTVYEEIIDIYAIGAEQNPKNLNELLRKAGEEKLQPSRKNSEQVLVIGIDYQNDFMEGGALGVPGACGDVERFTRFIYNNMDKIAKIAISIDTHNPFQIFYPCWWVDQDGNNVPPYTLITVKDLDDGKWLPVIDPVKSRQYVEGLAQKAKKDLFIWPYHCIQGTFGCAIENQLSNMVYFHSVAKNTIVNRIVKGQDPYSEMYGIFAPEFDYGKGYINIDVLNKIAQFDKIVIGGEAKSHCVLESIRQLLEYYANDKKITSKVYILEDCMSNIAGFEKMADDAFNEFKKKYNVNIVDSVSFAL